MVLEQDIPSDGLGFGLYGFGGFGDFVGFGALDGLIWVLGGGSN
jgi:hypothetical protein